jgi:hypothetical protein
MGAENLGLSLWEYYRLKIREALNCLLPESQERLGLYKKGIKKFK